MKPKWFQNGLPEASGRLLGGSCRQMAAEEPRWSRSWWPLGAVLAVLGPLLPRLGQLLALLGAVLGLPGRSLEGPGEGLGGSLGRCFWSSAPEPEKSSFSQTLGCFFNLFLKSFLEPLLSSLRLRRRGRKPLKTGFRMEGVSMFASRAFARASQNNRENKRNNDAESSRKTHR